MGNGLSMSKQLRRRAVLGGLAGGLAGMAGCSGLGLDVPDGSDPETTSPTSGTDTATSTATEQSQTSWGPSIPTYPYRQTATDPLNAKPDPDVLNPVLTAGHVTDVDATFVADPFMFVENNEWHMFFEVYKDKGRIAHATGKKSGTVWSYDQVVLERDFHISFPQVFKWKGKYYMTTEEQTSIIRLYQATNFPTKWTEVDTLYNPTHFGGPSVSDQALFRWKGRWWSIAGARQNTYLFYSDSLVDGEWKAHENNPVVQDRPRGARPGGRPIVRDDNVLVFYQDVKDYYGKLIRAYRITDLSPNSFSDHEVDASPVLEPTGEGGSWNSHRMHHYDPWSLGDGNGWRIAVDGDKSGNDWTIGIYRAQ